MEFREKRLTIAEAKEIDMVNYLSQLGYEPTTIRANDHWYLSPLREETTASFKVNQKLNRWYDYGLSKGGNLIGFGMFYKRCGVVEALSKLSGNFSLQQHLARPVKLAKKDDRKINILSDFLLSSVPLFNYLKKRFIPAKIASQFCREVRYEISGKTCYGIGFKNDLGGFEIRNAYHTLSSSPKGITTLKNVADCMAVFEGFFDFPSFVVIHKSEAFNSTDFIVLSFLAFLESTQPILDGYKTTCLFFDNDTAGKEATQLALSWGDHHLEKSELYQNYKDLNDWLVNAADEKMYRQAEFTTVGIIPEKPPNLFKGWSEP